MARKVPLVAVDHLPRVSAWGVGKCAGGVWVRDCHAVPCCGADHHFDVGGSGMRTTRTRTTGSGKVRRRTCGAVVTTLMALAVAVSAAVQPAHRHRLPQCGRAAGADWAASAGGKPQAGDGHAPQAVTGHGRGRQRLVARQDGLQLSAWGTRRCAIPPRPGPRAAASSTANSRT